MAVAAVAAVAMKIRGAVARAPMAALTLEDLTLDPPRDDEVLVRVVATGVCHTDIAMRDKVFPVPQPIVLGHEGAGIVEQVGRSVRKVRVGDSVVMTYHSCGHCPSCYSAKRGYCHNFFACNFAGSRADGSTALSVNNTPVHSHFFGQSSFATHAVCNERNVIAVPSNVPLELLGPLACGIQTGAGAAINALSVREGHSLAVFGTGSVGLSAIMGAALCGATTVVAIDLNEERLTLARELGATHAFNPIHTDVPAAVRALHAAGLDFSLDTTGLAPVIGTAVEILAPLGVCGLLGASDLSAEVSLNIAHLMTAGRSVRGIIEGDSIPELFIPTLIELYRQGRFPFDRLVRFYAFDSINEAIQDSESGRAIKAVVRMT
jgi:aryl-alcohol dehydrogenase